MSPLTYWRKLMLDTGKQIPASRAQHSAALPPINIRKSTLTREVVGAIKTLRSIDRECAGIEAVTPELLRPLIMYLSTNTSPRCQLALTHLRDSAPELWPELSSIIQTELAGVLAPLHKSRNVQYAATAFARLNALTPELLDLAERQIASFGVSHDTIALVELGEALLISSMDSHRIHGTLLRALGADGTFLDTRSSNLRFRVKSYGLAIPSLGPEIVGGLLQAAPLGLEEIPSSALYDVCLKLGRINVRRPDITRTIESRMDTVVAELSPNERAELFGCTNFSRGYTPEKLWQLIGASRRGWSLGLTSFEAHSWILAGIGRDPLPLKRSPFKTAILTDLSRSARKYIAEATVIQSAKVIAALGKFRHYDEQLLTLCGEKVLHGLHKLDTMQLLPVLGGMSKVLFHHPKATPLIIERVVKDLNLLRPKQRAELFFCMAQLNELDSEMGREVLASLKGVIKDLPTMEAINVAWSAGILPDLRGVPIWHEAGRVALRKPHEIARADWISIYEGCIASGAQCPPSLERIVFPLLEKREFPSNQPSHLERAVAGALRDLKLEYEEEFWVRPYRVDFKVTKPDGAEVFLEVDGVKYHYVAGNTTRPFGRHVIKEKVMANLGHDVIHLRSDEWDAAADKHALLRERLGIAAEESSQAVREINGVAQKTEPNIAPPSTRPA